MKKTWDVFEHEIRGVFGHPDKMTAFCLQNGSISQETREPVSRNRAIDRKQNAQHARSRSPPSWPVIHFRAKVANLSAQK